MSPTPPEDTIPEGDDLIAAEYVLGVLPAEERRERTARLAKVATALPPSAWLAQQVDAI